MPPLRQQDSNIQHHHTAKVSESSTSTSANSHNKNSNIDRNQSPSPSTTSADSESYQDRYFAIVSQHIGTFVEFSQNFTQCSPEEVIGLGAECTVYRGRRRHVQNDSAANDDQMVAILEYKLKSKQELIHWFSKFLLIQQCKYYSLYRAFMCHSECKRALQSQTAFTVYLVQELLDANLTEICTNIALQNHASKNPAQKQLQISSGAKQLPTDQLTETKVRLMALQIVQQLQTLMVTHNLCHLDIKPTNIMRRRRGRQQQNQYTMIDFGFSTPCNSAVNGYIGTQEWSAPEMRPAEAQNTVYESTDMWSLGLLVIYCLFGGTHPFCSRRRKAQTSMQTLQEWYRNRVLNKQSYIEVWLGKQLIDNCISYDLFDFLLKCSKYDPTKRITPTQALLHRWLRAVK